MLFSENYYRDRISKLGIPEMPIKKVVFNPDNLFKCEKLYSDFFKISKKLMQFIYYNNLEDLVGANFSNESIMKMYEGIVPENIDIYLKVPFEYGGTLDFSNMFLVKKRPFKELIDNFIDEQVLSFNKEQQNFNSKNGYQYPTELYICNPKGIVFLPALKGFAGVGGNTSADIMTEIGSTMFSKSGGF
ncbi:MAG: hypothetical protein ACI4N3_04530 [Alphaproteobacteria bacterium]